MFQRSLTHHPDAGSSKALCNVGTFFYQITCVYNPEDSQLLFMAFVNPFPGMAFKWNSSLAGNFKEDIW